MHTNLCKTKQQQREVFLRDGQLIDIYASNTVADNRLSDASADCGGGGDGGK